MTDLRNDANKIEGLQAARIMGVHPWAAKAEGAVYGAMRAYPATENSARAMLKRSISNAIERLKASRQKCQTHAHASHTKGECRTPIECEARDRGHGIEVGKEWAMTRAEWHELEDVAALSGEMTFAVLAVVLRAHGYDPEKLAEDFGCDDYPDKFPADAEVAGFIEGARRIKSAVDAA